MSLNKTQKINSLALIQYTLLQCPFFFAAVLVSLSMLCGGIVHFFLQSVPSAIFDVGHGQNY